MNDFLSQLYDIEGLDSISWWPLAPGWWVLISIFALILIGVGVYYYQRRKFRQSWQWRILSQLSFMEKNLKEENSHSTLCELSELIRRITMHQYSRTKCAGLEGRTWLLWLKEHDPYQFDWEHKGKFLIEAPYAPAPLPVSLEEILNIIKAIRGWVK